MENVRKIIDVDTVLRMNEKHSPRKYSFFFKNLRFKKNLYSLFAKCIFFIFSP